MGGKVVVVRDDMICSRNTINGVYLLKTLTQGRGVPPEEEASLEILYNEVCSQTQLRSLFAVSPLIKFVKISIKNFKNGFKEKSFSNFKDYWSLP